MCLDKRFVLKAVAKWFQVQQIFQKIIGLGNTKSEESPQNNTEGETEHTPDFI